MKITDGKGTGKEAAVSGGNRLESLAITEDYNTFHTTLGHAYNINTGTVTLTNATETGMLYIKNNEDRDLIITALIYMVGASTGGSGDISVITKKNPTTGTLISGGTDFLPINRDFGSANSLTATVKKGATGSTVTDGTDFITSIFTGPGRYVVSVGAIILRKGNSITVSIVPQAGNTSVPVQIAASAYLDQSGNI